MFKQSELTQERLKELLHYDPETGLFTWKVELDPRIKIGSAAGGTIQCSGYKQIWIDKKLYMAHRLAWLYVKGSWPSSQIDHINGFKEDNRFANLRQATNSENHRNTGKRTTNTSGYKGVSFHKASNKWRAQIQVSGVKIYLGLYDTPEEAHAAYCEAADRLHGDFANHG